MHPPQEITPSQVPANRYLALGDSYTIGEGVAAVHRWPAQLADSLVQHGHAVQLAKVIARTGWRTDQLLQAMDAQLGKGEFFELVSVQIGVNNQYQGRPIAEYEEELRTILLRAISFCKLGKQGVFVLSIPDYGATPFGASQEEAIGEAIGQWNAACRKICEELDIAFYNITPISKQAKANPSLLASDHLHPSAKMYQLWVKEILEQVEQRHLPLHSNSKYHTKKQKN